MSYSTSLPAKNQSRIFLVVCLKVDVVKFQTNWTSRLESKKYVEINIERYFPPCLFTSSVIMQHISPLYITFFAALIAANTEIIPALESKQNFCDCYRPDCERFESSPTFWDKVRLHKKPSEKGKIFCFSDQPIKWTFGSSSAQVAI